MTDYPVRHGRRSSQQVHISLRLLQERVWWFTSMVGEKATLKALRLLLHQLSVPYDFRRFAPQVT